jgi:glycosyltransferase involved in cell wall biosynthesis
MRVAHIITRMIVGGAQENTLLCCRDLIRTFGDDVLLVTGPSLGPEGSLLDRVLEEGIPCEVISSLRRPIHPLRDGIAYRRIRRVLQQYQPDVVHTHSAKGGMLGRRAAFSLRVPAIVHTVHGAPFHRYQSWAAREFVRWCECRAAGWCHKFVSVADAMTDLLVQGGVAPREKFVTIESGMEVEPLLSAGQHRDELRQRLGYDDDHFVVGKIARLFHLKGHEYLIDAARRIVEQTPQVRFLLIGDGVLRDRLARQIRDHKLDKYFRFTGLVPPEQIPPLIAATDLLVHASLREGLARSLPQALLVGRPVISFDVDGAREVVDHERTGLLVAPRNSAGLAAAIKRLADDPALRSRLAAAGQSACADRFRHEWMTQRLRETYAALLSHEAA